MQNSIARIYLRWILPLLVLLWLTACASEPRVVETVRTVTVEVPVVQKIDVRLLKDCDPGGAYVDPNKMPIGEMKDRLGAVEDCLAILRNNNAELRSLQ